MKTKRKNYWSRRGKLPALGKHVADYLDDSVENYCRARVAYVQLMNGIDPFKEMESEQPTR